MRLADYMLVPKNRNVYGAFWPSGCATPQKFDAEEDADRAAFAFWKKSQGIHIDKRQHVYQESVPTSESITQFRSCPQCEERLKRYSEAGGCASMQVASRPGRCSGEVNGLEPDRIDPGDLRALDSGKADRQKIPSHEDRNGRMQNIRARLLPAIPEDLAAAFPGCISITTRQASDLSGRAAEPWGCERPGSGQAGDRGQATPGDRWAIQHGSKGRSTDEDSNHSLGGIRTAECHWAAIPSGRDCLAFSHRALGWHAAWGDSLIGCVGHAGHTGGSPAVGRQRARNEENRAEAHCEDVVFETRSEQGAEVFVIAGRPSCD